MSCVRPFSFDDIHLPRSIPCGNQPGRRVREPLGNLPFFLRAREPPSRQRVYPSVRREATRAEIEKGCHNSPREAYMVVRTKQDRNPAPRKANLRVAQPAERLLRKQEGAGSNPASETGSTSSRASAEWPPPSQGGDRGFKSRRGYSDESLRPNFIPGVCRFARQSAKLEAPGSIPGGDARSAVGRISNPSSSKKDGSQICPLPRRTDWKSVLQGNGCRRSSIRRAALS